METKPLQQQQNQCSDEYTEKIHNFLHQGKFNIYTIDNICAKENQERFISIVKAFIAENPLCGWEFTNGFKKLHRVNLDFTPKKIKRGLYG